jgi:phage repressor protein C with HTH and peptisase S24 domain
MKVIGIISTATLSLFLGVAAPIYAQDQQDQKQEQKDTPAEKKAQHDKNAKQEDKNTKQQDKNNQQQQRNAQQENRNTQQEEKSAQQQEKNNKQEDRNTQQTPRSAGNHDRIPADRYQANFGREHSFHVSQSDYSRDRRFQYGGYWFGFVDAWPSNWLYTQDVYVVEINGVYYLCNPAYPGVNITLSIAD